MYREWECVISKSATRFYLNMFWMIVVSLWIFVVTWVWWWWCFFFICSELSHDLEETNAYLTKVINTVFIITVIIIIIISVNTKLNINWNCVHSMRVKSTRRSRICQRNWKSMKHESTVIIFIYCICIDVTSVCVWRIWNMNLQLSSSVRNICIDVCDVSSAADWVYLRTSWTVWIWRR